MEFEWIKGKKPSELTEKDLLIEICYLLKKKNEIEIAK